MSKRNEIKAAELHEKCIEAVLKGRYRDVEQLIKLCPADEREGLKEAIEGAKFMLLNYTGILARPSLVKRASERIGELKRRQELIEAAEARARKELIQEPIGEDEIMSLLQRILCIQSIQSRPSVNKLGSKTMYRNRNETIAPSKGYDKLEIDLAIKQAEIHAHNLWLNFGAPKPPINPKEIAKFLGLVVMEYTTSDCDGCIRMEGDVGGILLNAGISNEARKRFTLAHEIAHFELHRDRFSSVQESLSHMENSTAIEEIAANAFASELLMPEEYINSSFSRHEPTFALIESLANDYQVSITAAARRIVKLSNFACALICYMGGKATWFERSEDFPYFLSLKDSPPRYSGAAALLAGEKPSDRAVISQAIWWAPEDRKAEIAELYEHSRVIFDGCILTLLFMKDLQLDQ